MPTPRTRNENLALNALADQIHRSREPAGVRLAALARLARPELTQKELAALVGLCVRNCKRGDRLIEAMLQAQKGACAVTPKGTVQSPQGDCAVTFKGTVQSPSRRPIARASLYRSLKILKDLSLSAARARRSAAAGPPTPPGDRFAAPLASRASPQEAPEQIDAPAARGAFGAGFQDHAAARNVERGETERIDAVGAPTPEREEAEREREQAARRVLDCWARTEQIEVRAYSRKRLDLVLDRLAEYAEETLYDAIRGARFDRDYFAEPARRVPELLFRDGRNVEQCLRALPARRKVTPPAPPPESGARIASSSADELEQRRINLDGAGMALAALR